MNEQSRKEIPVKGVVPCLVSCQWLNDSDLYNEWMNEMDYLVNDDVQPKSHPNTPIDVDYSLEDQDEVDAPYVPLNQNTQWPRVSIVNLDRRLPVKFKRQDYEPPTNPIITNLSPSIFMEPQASVLPPPVKVVETSQVSEVEQYTLGHYWGESESEKKNYMNLRNMVLEAYQVHQKPITLLTLRRLAPHQDIVYLQSILLLLEHLKLVNSMVMFLIPGSSAQLPDALST